MRRTPLLLVALLGVGVAPVQAAPEGFRLSAPLTKRAVTVGGSPAVTVHCSRTMADWRRTAEDAEGADAVGRADRATDEVFLPTTRCATLERWLRGQRVYPDLLAWALFIYGHELGHIVLDTPGEQGANCYAARKFNVVARTFGVKSAATLRALRDELPLAC